MNDEKQEKAKGTLILAATSLGLPEDMPQRSLAALRSADLLIFEEDRPARSFLKAAGVHRSYLKFSEHQQEETLAELSKALKAGRTALYMSDQGTPGLADPGRDLAQTAFRLGASIRVIPGPSSVSSAIAACPFDCRAFTFAGFLPRAEAARQKALQDLSSLPHPCIVLDTPYRLEALLASCTQIFAKGRRGFLALDISGACEDYWLGDFAELTSKATALSESKLNFVLIVDGRPH